MARLLWIDDEYRRYEVLADKLKEAGWIIEYASTLVEARGFLIRINEFDAILLDIILREGAEYRPEDVLTGRIKTITYVGLTFLAEIGARFKGKIKVVVLTIAEDPTVLQSLHRWERQGVISEVLLKGNLTEDDVFEAVERAITPGGR